MKYNPINNVLYIANRANFISKLKPNSVAIFFSNDILPTNADGSIMFIQNSDLLFLTGVDQEESILVLFPDAKSEAHKQILFVKETNDHIAIWEGEKLSKSQATNVSGITNIQWAHLFDGMLQQFMFMAEHIYLNGNEHTRQYISMQTAQNRNNIKIKQLFPLHKIERSAPIMHAIRSVKHVIEIEQIQHACNITEKGFRRLLTFIKPGVMEYEIEAELIHEFVKNRSRRFAYTPIIASGANACVLHYIENNKVCNDGDLILLDVAAEYANYASDLTRCVPANGKFSPRQKEVYNAVLHVMKSSINMLSVGNTFEKYNKAVGELMTEELIKLKLLTTDQVKNAPADMPAYKKYFMHGTSHFLGLDVHDVGFFTEPMKAGNVFTCEPGIYIPQEGLGIRIENNILVTNNGQQDLMTNIPVEVEEIEFLMAKR